MESTANLIPKVIASFGLCIVSHFLIAQDYSAGINTETPNPNAVLHLVSPNGDQGLLIPTLTTVQRTLMTLTVADNGLLVFDTTNGLFYYYFNEWIALDNDAIDDKITSATISGNTLIITEGGNDIVVDLSAFDSAPQDIITDATAGNIALTGGATLTLNVDDADADPLNEIQDISTDATAGNLTIAGGSTLTLNVDDLDADPTNEIELPATAALGQVLEWDGAAWVASTDDGALPTGTIIGQVLEWDGTNWVVGTDDVNDADADPLNEIELPATAVAGQVLEWDGAAWVASTDDGTLPTGTIVGQVLEWDGANWVVGTDDVDDADPDPLNEIQDISTDATAGNLTIAGGSTLTLNVDDADADPLNEIELPATAVAGQVLEWDGNNWVAAANDTGLTTVITNITLSGDGTGASPLSVNRVDPAIIAAGGATPGQILEFDGTNWIPAANTPTLAANSVTTTEILDGTIADIDISGTANITASKLQTSVMLETENISLLTNDAGYLATVSADGTTILGDGDVTALSVNVGTGANQIVQLDAAGALPAVDGSNLTGITPTLAAGSVTTTEILDGTITDIDISATAGIATSKLVNTVMVETENISLLTNDAGYLATVSADGTTILGDGDVTPLSVNTGTGPDQIVQLDAGGALPAVDGSALTGITPALAVGSVTTTEILDGTIANIDIADVDWTKLTGVPVGFADGTDDGLTALNIDATTLGGDGDVTPLTVNVGTGANQIVQLDAGGALPAVDGSALTGIVPTLAAGSVTTTEILDGTIADIDIVGTANIAASKLETSVMLETENISLLTNDAGYVTPGENVSVFTNDAGYLATVSTDGTTITGDGDVTPLSVNTGTGPDQIVQLDAGGALPAVDGSALTGIVPTLAAGSVTTTEILDGTIADIDIADVDWVKLTGVPVGFADGTDDGLTALNIDATTLGGDGDVTPLTVNVGTGANQIVQLDGTGALPILDGSNLTGVNAVLAAGQVTTTEILDGTIANIDIADVDWAKLTGIPVDLADGDDIGLVTVNVDGITILGDGDATALSVDETALTIANTQVTGLGTASTADAGTTTGAVLQLPAAVAGDILEYDGTNWVTGVDDTGLATVNVDGTTILGDGDATALSVDETALTIANTQVTGLGTASTADAGTTTGAVLQLPAAVAGEILEYDGTNWVTGVDDTGLATVNVDGTTILGDGDATALSVDETALTIANTQVTGLGTASTADAGTTTGAVLQLPAAVAGEILEYDGTNWVTGVDDTGLATVNADGTTILGDGDATALSVDETALTIANTQVTGLGTASTADAGTTTGAVLQLPAAVAGEILEYDGTNWVTGVDDTGLATVNVDGTTITGDGDATALSLNSVPLTTIADGGAISGQVLEYDGANWVPGTDDGMLATTYDPNTIAGDAFAFDTHVSTTVAVAGDVLTFDGAAWDAAAPVGLTLPFSDNVAAAGNLFAITNSGLGGSGFFEINNGASLANALNASTNGTGSALSVTHAGPGVGIGADIAMTQATSTGPALSINHAGLGSGIEISTTTGPPLFIPGGAAGDVLTTDGLGNITLQPGGLTLPYNQTFTGTGADLLAIINDGTGGAGNFQIANTGNADAALSAATDGSGAAILATQTGATGPGISIDLTGAANPTAGLAINHGGTGPGISLTTLGPLMNIPGGAAGEVLTSDASGNITLQPGGGVSFPLSEVQTNADTLFNLTNPGSGPAAGFAAAGLAASFTTFGGGTAVQVDGNMEFVNGANRDFGILPNPGGPGDLLNVYSGDATSGNGGDLVLSSGLGAAGGNGGNILLVPGAGGGGGFTGGVFVNGITRFGNPNAGFAALLELENDGGTAAVGIRADSSMVTNYNLLLPATQGTGALTNDGTGNLSWVTGGSGAFSLDGNNNLTAITGAAPTGSNNILAGSSAGNAVTTGSDNILLGLRAGQFITNGQLNVFIGSDAGNALTTGTGNVAIGQGAGVGTTGSQNIAIGQTSEASGITSVAIGANTKARGDNAVALGSNTTVDGANSIALGSGVNVAQDNSAIIGNPGTPDFRVGVGTATPAGKLDVIASGTLDGVNIINTGTGKGIGITLANPTNTAGAIFARHQGDGSVAVFDQSNAGTIAPVLSIVKAGSGPDIQLSGVGDLFNVPGGLSGHVLTSDAGGNIRLQPGGGISFPLSVIQNNADTLFNVTNTGAGPAAGFVGSGLAASFTSTSGGTAVQVDGNVDAGGDITLGGNFIAPTRAYDAVANGPILPSDARFIRVTASPSNINTIAPGIDGQEIIIISNVPAVFNIQPGGNLRLQNFTFHPMEPGATIHFVWVAALSQWVEISRSI